MTKNKNRKNWSQDELDLLKKFYKTNRDFVFTQLVGRTRQQISSRAYKLGLSKPQNRYSYDEDKIICEKVLLCPNYTRENIRETMKVLSLKGFVLRSINSYSYRFSNFSYLIYGVGYSGCSKQCKQVYHDLVV